MDFGCGWMYGNVALHVSTPRSFPHSEGEANFCGGADGRVASALILILRLSTGKEKAWPVVVTRKEG